MQAFQNFKREIKRFHNQEQSRTDPIILKGMEDSATAVQYCDLADNHGLDSHHSHPSHYKELMVLGLRSGTLLAYSMAGQPGTSLMPLTTTNNLHNGPIVRALVAPFLGGVLTARCVLSGIHHCTLAGRERGKEVLEWPYTMGAPPPPPTKVTIAGKRKFTIGKILSGHFWYTTFWVADAPLPPFQYFPEEGVGLVSNRGLAVMSARGAHLLQ